MENFTNEINQRLSQEVDSMISMMHTSIIRTISTTKAERVIQEIQSMVSSLSSGNTDTESGSSSNNQANKNGTTPFKTKVTKRTVGLPLIYKNRKT